MDKNERLAFINMYKGFWSTLPEPDGTIDATARKHFIRLSHIPLAAGASSILRLVRRRRRRRS